ncbi:HNH endonuclease [Candidatus Poribacteria bacterium]|nr:HNH endonuclease [Candidatus Poribacteria bacterium]
MLMMNTDTTDISNVQTGSRRPMRAFADHILPRSQGGTDHPKNLQLLCQACNSTKGQGTQEELIERLKAQGIGTD